MYGLNKMAVWVMTGLQAVLTIFFNGYIFLASLRSYRQNRKWSASETIIVALAAADVTHQVVCYFWMTMDEVDKGCRTSSLYYAVMVVLIFSFKFTIMWDTGFLTFYYSTKLVSSPNRCYTSMQAAILKHVALAVVLIPLCGLGTCMPMLVVFHSDNYTRADRDCGVLFPDTAPGLAYEVVYLLLADVLPGLLMVKCCVSISVHLALHLRSMKASTNGAHGPKLGSQMRVIQMALSLVAIFVVFLVVDLYVNYEIVVNHENAIVLTFFFTSAYTTVAAMVLIYGKKTLWKALVHEYNALLDGSECLSCLKVPEHKAEPNAPPKVQN